MTQENLVIPTKNIITYCNADPLLIPVNSNEYTAYCQLLKILKGYKLNLLFSIIPYKNTLGVGYTSSCILINPDKTRIDNESVSSYYSSDDRVMRNVYITAMVLLSKHLIQQPEHTKDTVEDYTDICKLFIAYTLFCRVYNLSGFEYDRLLAQSKVFRASILGSDEEVRQQITNIFAGIAEIIKKNPTAVLEYMRDVPHLNTDAFDAYVQHITHYKTLLKEYLSNDENIEALIADMNDIQLAFIRANNPYHYIYTELINCD